MVFRKRKLLDSKEIKDQINESIVEICLIQEEFKDSNDLRDDNNEHDKA